MSFAVYSCVVVASPLDPLFQSLLQFSMLVVSFGVPESLKIMKLHLVVVLQRTTRLVVVVTVFKGLAVYRFRYASSMAIGTTNCCRHILSVCFLIRCPKFKFLLRSFTIVTISRFKLLYSEPYLCFTMILYS